LTKREKKRVYIGVAVLIAALFCAGILAGYVSRNDKLCADGKAPTRQRPDVALGHIVYQCHDGQLVTK
jgi:hypothetical protein